jgi:hypothetical protein
LIQFCSAPFATAAGSKTHGVCNSFDGIAQADFFFNEKTGKANAMEWMFQFRVAILGCDFLFHETFLVRAGAIAS